MVVIVTTVSLRGGLLYIHTYCTVSTQTSCFVQLSWSEYLSVWSPQGINLSCCKLHYDQEYGTSVQFHWENPASPPSPHLCRRNLVIGGQGRLLCIWDLSVRPPAPVVWCFLTLFLGVWEPAYLWAATSLFCHTSRGFWGPWGPSAPCGGSGWSLQMGLLHMGQTLRISSHFTRHLSRRQSEKRRDGFVMHQLSIDSSALWPRHKMTGWNCRMFLNNQKSDRCYSRRLILIFKLLCLDSLICGSCFSASNNILCVRNLHAWMFLKECVVLNVHIVKHQSVFTAS